MTLVKRQNYKIIERKNQILTTSRDIAEKFEKGSGELPLYPVSRMAHVVGSDLLYFNADLESDINKWFLCQRKGQQFTLLLYGTLEWDEDYFYAGNRPLSVVLEVLWGELDVEPSSRHCDTVSAWSVFRNIATNKNIASAEKPRSSDASFPC